MCGSGGYWGKALWQRDVGIRLIIAEKWPCLVASRQIIYEETGPTCLVFWGLPLEKKLGVTTWLQRYAKKKKAEFSKHKSLASQNWFQNLSLISINFNKVVLKCILCLQCSYSYVFEVELIWCQTNVIHSSARPSILSWKETW